MSDEPQSAQDGLTRRTLIAGAAVAGAAAALPDAAEARHRKHKHKHRKHHKHKHKHHKHHKRAPGPATARSADVVVVGAGYAGLTAAREVARAGRSVLVLEARDRVGGRILNHPIAAGKYAEAGGEYVGPTQDHILALIKAMGVDVFSTYDKGNNLYIAGGSRMTYSDSSPTGTAPPDPTTLADVTAVIAQLDQMATGFPVDAPWTSPNAVAWDGQTLETFLKANSSGSARFMKLTSIATRAIFGAEPRELSLLFTVFYIASAGNETTQGTFERLFNTQNGAQQYRFVGGSQQVPLKMAAQLGGAVVLGHPTRRIAQTGSGVQVITDAQTFVGKRVIVAMSPMLSGRLIYDPLLPNQRDQLTQRLPQGTLIKAEAVYDRPFWRDANFTGTCISDTDPCNATFDNTPPDGTPGVLFGFIGGDAARDFASLAPDQRKARVIANFVNYFGSAAAHPRDYFEMNWTSEEFTRGCPVGFAPPGTLLRYAPALRPPVGSIHWAGTETSTYWNGYMDGAVRSGERAAREVLAEL